MTAQIEYHLCQVFMWGKHGIRQVLKDAWNYLSSRLEWGEIWINNHKFITDEVY